MNDVEIIAAEVELGEEARNFIESDIGRLILGRAQAEIDEALVKLADIDHQDSKEILKLQNQIWRARSIVQWIAQAIEAGDDAIQHFTETQET